MRLPRLLLLPLLCAALPALGEIPRVGILASGTCERSQPFYAAMRERGYIEGRNIEYDCVLIVDRIAELPLITSQMVARKPALIVANASPAIRAAQRATSTVPIVMHGSADAVREGFVQGLARPDGNTTGVTFSTFDLVSKRLELGRELVPKAKRLGVIYRSGADREPFMVAFKADMATLAPRMGFEVKYYPVMGVGEAAEALRRMGREGTDLVYLVETPILLGPHAAELARIVTASGLPTIGVTSYCAAGSAIACAGGSPDEIARRAAHYVDRILKGAKPADLPVEQPTKVEVTVNARTAKVLGVAIPDSLLQRADQVIE